MNVTYLGHSTFLINTGRHTLLFDPFISGNGLASQVKPDDVRCDFILVSHAHGDHIGDLVRIAKRTNAVVIGAYEVTTWAEKHGVTNTYGLNTGAFIEQPFGKLRVVSAQHSSSFPDGAYGGNPLGLLIQAEGKTFYYAGDTALTLDMQLIPRWHTLDACFLPVGNNFTMGYEDACTAAEFVQCDHVIGMHFDTFPSIAIDHDAAFAYFRERGKTLRLPRIAESFDL